MKMNAENAPYIRIIIAIAEQTMIDIGICYRALEANRKLSRAVRLPDDEVTAHTPGTPSKYALTTLNECVDFLIGFIGRENAFKAIEKAKNAPPPARRGRAYPRKEVTNDTRF